MRRLVLLLCLLSLAACSAGGPTPAGTPDAGTSAAARAGDGDGDEDGLAFARCMREQGLTWFRDPAPDQRGVRIDVPKGADRATVDAAMEACRHLLPNGGRPPKADAESLAEMRKMSQCMRENGVPDFPGPTAEGGIRIDGDKLGTGPGDPVYDQAEKTCSHLMPEPPAGEKREGE